MHSIRIKMMAVTIAAIITSLLALGGTAMLILRVESDQSSIEKLSAISVSMQRLLDGYLNSLQQSMVMGIHMADDSLEELSLNLLSSSRSPEDLEKFNNILSQHCSEVEHAFASIANNTNGIVTYYYCINSDLGSSEHGFFWSNLDEDKFVLQDPLISTDLDINDIEHTTWYYSPLKAGRAVWVGPYKAHFLNERLTISYVAPIYKYGFLIGVLGMDILFETIVSQISDLKVYDTGFVFLIDKDGKILYHPTFEIGSTPDVEFKNVDPDLFKRRNSNDALIRYYEGGEEKQLAFSTLINNIKVVVTAPVSEINATQKQLSLLILLVAVVLLGTFTVITLLLVDALTRPLQRLTAASRRLAEGDYNVELDYNGNDEVGILTKSFIQMRNKLELYISDLNSRVYTDALTGVKNKGAYDISVRRLNDEIHIAENGNYPEFSIIMFDCNSLKQINDEYGHDRGDTYLQSASALICRVFSRNNVFRLGGDEFAVLLQQDQFKKRDELLETFDRIVQEHNSAVENPWEKVSLSKGIADYRAGYDQNAEQVMHRADERMYADKKHK